MRPEPPVLGRNRGSDQRGRQLPRIEMHAARAIARQRFVQWNASAIDHNRRSSFVQIEERGIDLAESDPHARTGDHADDHGKRHDCTRPPPDERAETRSHRRTSITAVGVRPKTSGSYISSARAGAVR